MRKNVIKSILGVALATGVLGGAVFATVKAQESPATEAKAYNDYNTSHFLYVDVTTKWYESNPTFKVKCAKSGDTNAVYGATASTPIYGNVYKVYYPNYNNTDVVRMTRWSSDGKTEWNNILLSTGSWAQPGQFIKVTDWSSGTWTSTVNLTIKQIFNGKERASDTFPVGNNYSTTLSSFDNYLSEFDDSYYVAGYYSDSALTNKITSKTITSDSTIYAKCIEAKYVFFTNNYSWTSIYVTNSGSVTNRTTYMSKLFKNSSNQDVYYAAIPGDSTSIVFGGYSGSSQTNTVTIGLTPANLDNTQAWYISGDGGGLTSRTVAAWSLTSNYYGLHSGEYYYINVSNTSVMTSSPKIAAKFWNDSEGHYGHAGAQVSESKTALGLSNYNIYEIQVPKHNKYYINMLVCRYDPAYDPYTDGDHIWTQCSDRYMTTGNTGSQYQHYANITAMPSNLTVSWGDEWNYGTVYATIYGYHIIQQTNGVCDSEGNTNLSTLATKWTALSTEYSGLSSVAQWVLWKGTASQTGNYLAKGLARYDYIVLVKKYNLITNTDFINRNDAESGSAYHGALGASTTVSPLETIMGKNGEANYILIVVIASVTLMAIGGFFFLRKRRQDR